MTDEYHNNICLKCSRLQETCCSDSPRVPFTIQDLERLSSLGYRLEDFAVVGEYLEKDFRRDEDWWKNAMIKIGDKFSKINVRKKEDGSCYFLDREKGCTLGQNKPVACKIYPYWIDRGCIIWEDGEMEFCLMGKEEFHILEGIRMIGETEYTIRAYFEEIKRDCLENNEKHRGLLLRLLKNI